MLNIVVPMAGRGSRFAKEGFTDPKPLIDILGKRMIEVVINNLTPRIEHKFIFICQNEHLVKYSLAEKLNQWAPGCEIVSINGITEGAACTVLCAKSLINNNDGLMIANSDQWVDVEIDKYLLKMETDQLDGLIMTMKASDPKWSYVNFNKLGKVSKVVEKVVVSDEATVGIYNYRRGADFVKYAEKMIENDERSNNEFYVAPVYTHLYEQESQKIGVYNVGEEAKGMYGLGIPGDLELFLNNDISTKALDF